MALTKAEKQAETARRIKEAQDYQRLNADDEDIDDLLGNIPETPSRTLRKKDINAIKGPVIPRNNNYPMIAFKNKAGHQIIGPGQKYYVVRTNDGKLHYKEMSQVIFLPDTWQEGDPIPGLTVPKIIDDLLG
jgi:hypothetical protein